MTKPQGDRRGYVRIKMFEPAREHSLLKLCLRTSSDPAISHLPKHRRDSNKPARLESLTGWSAVTHPVIVHGQALNQRTSYRG